MIIVRTIIDSFTPCFYSEITSLLRHHCNVSTTWFIFVDLSSLGGVTDPPRVLPETSNPLFLSHGNLAISLGLGCPTHPHLAHANSLARNLTASGVATSQTNSASNLAYPTNPRTSVYDAYYPPLGPSTISGSVDASGFATGWTWD